MDPQGVVSSADFSILLRKYSRGLPHKVEIILSKYDKIKGKVFPVFAMKAYGASGVTAPPILNHGTRGTSVVNVTSRPLYPQEKNPGSHYIKGWVAPKNRLDVSEKINIFFPTGIRIQSVV